MTSSMKHSSMKHAMKNSVSVLALICAGLPAILAGDASAQGGPVGIANIDTVVVIYAENRSFDSLYGSFPGANGWQNVTPANSTQVDRDGSPLKELPPVWNGLTAKGVTPPVTEAQTAHLPNQPFAIDDPKGFNTSLSVTTRDLWHVFYQNQMQIDGGKNDRFAAFADSGGLVMGHYDGTKLPLWSVAQKYVLADNFFQGAFGGSFLNHFQFACACTPVYPNADQSPAKGLIAAVDADGVSLTLAPDSPKSAIDGVPKFVNNGQMLAGLLCRRNTHAAAVSCRSNNKPALGGDPRFAEIPAAPNTLLPQARSDHRRSFSACAAASASPGIPGRLAGRLRRRDRAPPPTFQFHHQVFNAISPIIAGHEAREHCAVSCGLTASSSLEAVDAGTLPQVCILQNRKAISTSMLAGADVTDGDTQYRRYRRASGEEPAMGAHAGRHRTAMRMAASGTTWRRPRPTAGVPDRASRPSSYRRSTSKGFTTTPNPTRPRSCALSPGASICRSWTSSAQT